MYVVEEASERIVGVIAPAAITENSGARCYRVTSQEKVIGHYLSQHKAVEALEKHLDPMYPNPEFQVHEGVSNCLVSNKMGEFVGQVKSYPHGTHEAYANSERIGTYFGKDQALRAVMEKLEG
jgi:ribosomal protein S19